MKNLLILIFLFLSVQLAFALNQTNYVLRSNNDIELRPQSKVIFGGNVNVEGAASLRLEDSTGGEYLALKAPSTVSSNKTFTLPDSYGNLDDCLAGDGGGVFAFLNCLTPSSTDTLTNKTIDADNNTISNIDNNEIKALAGIDATKISAGSVDNTEFDYLNGTTAAIQTQLNGKQGTLTNSAGLAAALSDETGSGFSVFGSGPLMSEPEMSNSILFNQIATPSNPAASKNKLYFKNDGNLYKLNSAGTEAQVGAASLSGVSDQQVVFGIGGGSGSGEANLIYDYTTNNLKLDGQFNLLTEKELRFEDASGGQYVGLKAPSTVSTSYTLTFPDAQGANNQVLKNNGSGALSWSNFSTSGGGANYLGDGGFENGFSGTCNTGTCTTPNTGAIQEGLQALNVSLSSQTADVEYCVTNTAWAGQNFRVSAWLKTSSALFNFCSSDDSGSGDDCVDVSSEDVYREYEKTRVVPASGKVCWRITTDSSTTASIRADASVIYNLQPKILSKILKQHAKHNAAGSTLTDRTNEVEFNTSNFALSGDDLITLDNSDGTRTKFICKKTAGCVMRGHINFDASDSTTSQVIRVYKDIAEGAFTDSASCGSSSTHPTSSYETSLMANFNCKVAYNGFITIRFFADVANSASPAFVDMEIESIEQDQAITSQGFNGAGYKFTNLPGCDSTFTSGTPTDVVDVDCVYNSANGYGGTVTPTTSGGIALKLAYLPAGTFDIEVNGDGFADGNEDCTYELYDQTNGVTIDKGHSYNGAASHNQRVQTIRGTKEYTSPQTNIEWRLRVKDGGVGAAGCRVFLTNTDNDITFSVRPVSKVNYSPLKNYRYYEYYGQGNASIATSSEERLQWDTAVQDDDSSVTTGASWVFTSKRNQICQVVAKATHTASGSILYAVDTSYWIRPYVNNTDISDRCLYKVPVTEVTSSSKTLICPFQIKLVAGDTLDFRMFQESGETATMETSRQNSSIKMTCFDN